MINLKSTFKLDLPKIIDPDHLWREGIPFESNMQFALFNVPLSMAKMQGRDMNILENFEVN